MTAVPAARADRATSLALLAVAVAAFVNYVRGFDSPAVPFWDERYYIVDAQKYLHGVYFLDLHPPLGKLLIALGERWFGQNPRTDQFLNITYWAQTIPDGFSFVGFRSIPVLLAWATAPLLFLVFLSFVRSRILATALSALYLFDNALVVHLRGAMLEGPLLFFAALLVLMCVRLTKRPASSSSQVANAATAGCALGCLLTLKAIAVVFVVLPAAVIWKMRPDRPRAITSLVVASAACIVVVAAVWEVHFSLARHVNPQLMEHGFYQNPSPAAREFLESSSAVPVAALPSMIAEAARYSRWYDAGRPAIDFCRADEKASPFWMWPIGARAVPYWWETADGGQSFRYLYLVVNPVVWWTALGGVIAAVALLASSLLVPFARPLKNRWWLSVFTLVYFAYFAPFPWIHGVMYLYHYFVPLLISFILLALVIDEIDHIGAWRVTLTAKQIAAAAWLCVAIAAFMIYKPLTYYERPMTAGDLQRRAIVALWDLRCITCPHADGLCGPASK